MSGTERSVGVLAGPLDCSGLEFLVEKFRIYILVVQEKVVFLKKVWTILSIYFPLIYQKTNPGNQVRPKKILKIATKMSQMKIHSI